MLLMGGKPHIAIGSDVRFATCKLYPLLHLVFHFHLWELFLWNDLHSPFMVVLFQNQDVLQHNILSTKQLLQTEQQISQIIA